MRRFAATHRRLSALVLRARSNWPPPHTTRSEHTCRAKHLRHNLRPPPLAKLMRCAFYGTQIMRVEVTPLFAVQICQPLGFAGIARLLYNTVARLTFWRRIGRFADLNDAPNKFRSLSGRAKDVVARIGSACLARQDESDSLRAAQTQTISFVLVGGGTTNGLPGGSAETGACCANLAACKTAQEEEILVAALFVSASRSARAALPTTREPKRAAHLHRPPADCSPANRRHVISRGRSKAQLI